MKPRIYLGSVCFSNTDSVSSGSTPQKTKTAIVITALAHQSYPTVITKRF